MHNIERHEHAWCRVKICVFWFFSLFLLLLLLLLMPCSAVQSVFINAWICLGRLPLLWETGGKMADNIFFFVVVF